MASLKQKQEALLDELLKDYYNDARVHASLDGNTPMEAGGNSTTRRADISHLNWQSHCHGLVQLPIAA